MKSQLAALSLLSLFALGQARADTPLRETTRVARRATWLVAQRPLTPGSRTVRSPAELNGVRLPFPVNWSKHWLLVYVSQASTAPRFVDFSALRFSLVPGRRGELVATVYDVAEACPKRLERTVQYVAYCLIPHARDVRINVLRGQELFGLSYQPRGSRDYASANLSFHGHVNVTTPRAEHAGEMTPSEMRALSAALSKLPNPSPAAGSDETGYRLRLTRPSHRRPLIVADGRGAALPSVRGLEQVLDAILARVRRESLAQRTRLTGRLVRRNGELYVHSGYGWRVADPSGQLDALVGENVVVKGRWRITEFMRDAYFEVESCLYPRRATITGRIVAKGRTAVLRHRAGEAKLIGLGSEHPLQRLQRSWEANATVRGWLLGDSGRPHHVIVEQVRPSTNRRGIAGAIEPRAR